MTKAEFFEVYLKMKIPMHYMETDNDGDNEFYADSLGNIMRRILGESFEADNKIDNGSNDFPQNYEQGIVVDIATDSKGNWKTGIIPKNCKCEECK